MQYPAIPDGFNYLRPVRTSGDKCPLFCFFPGEPGARDLTDCLPNDQPVYQFFYPNLDGALKFPAVDELASAYIQDIRKIQMRGPYQLCGYSKAGLLAYEAARLLLTQGEKVSLLALLETWHPRYVQNLRLNELVQFHLTHTAYRIKKYVLDLVQGELSNFVARAQDAVVKRVRLMAWRAARFTFQAANRPVPKNMQTIESTAVLKDFVPKPYPNRLLLFRTYDKFEMGLKDQTFGWSVCATEGVEVLFVLGDHGTLKDKPYVQSLADKIADHLATKPQNQTATETSAQ